MTLVTKIMWVQKGLRTRTVHCIQNHTVVDEKLCDNAVSPHLYSQALTKQIIIIHCLSILVLYDAPQVHS